MSFTSSKNPKTPRLKRKTVAGKRTSRTLAVLDTNLTHFPSILPRCFFLVDALDLSPLLLGKYLRRDDVVLQITEVEAYRQNDTASHSRLGITPRTKPMFGPGGHAYVYLCYGVHVMLNIVADEVGVGAGVLIRSCAPISGLKIIQERRGQDNIKPSLLAGLGKVGQALGLSKSWSNHPLYTHGGLEVLDGPKPEKILVGPRIGINYASPEHITAPWRFAIEGSSWFYIPHQSSHQEMKVVIIKDVSITYDSTSYKKHNLSHVEIQASNLLRLQSLVSYSGS